MRAFLLIFLFLTTLYADRDGGPYISVGYANGIIKDSDNLYDLKIEHDNNFKLALGAYINKYFTVELEYDFAFEFKEQDDTTHSFSILDINVQAHYPFMEDRFDVSAKFGAGEVYSSSTGFCLVFGVGASYHYNEKVGLKIGFDYIDIGVDTVNDTAVDSHLKLGVTYAMVEVVF